MSFPPYPSGSNTFYNKGYQQFWGRGFPYIADDFVGGISGLQYHTDDEDKVRKLPVMDLQNIVAKGKGKRGRPKKVKSEMEGGCMECESESEKEEKMKGGRKMKVSKKASKKGKGANPELLKKVMAYKRDNGVSLKEAWAAVKKGKSEDVEKPNEDVEKVDLKKGLTEKQKKLLVTQMKKCNKQEQVIADLDETRKQAEKAEEKYNKSIAKASKAELDKDHCAVKRWLEYIKIMS